MINLKLTEAAGQDDPEPPHDSDRQALMDPITVWHADGLPDRPVGSLVRGDDESDADYRDRKALLDLLLGA